MTFDTSLVDVKQTPPPSNETVSFTSTTASDSTIEMPPAPNPAPTKPIQHIPTQAAYNQWASIYDTDGNILQAIDDLELSSLLPALLSSVSSSAGTGGEGGNEINMLDLGCGTGRNTAKLLRHAWGARRVNVVGLDFSEKMLGVAGGKLGNLVEGQGEDGRVKVELRLECCDCFPTATISPTSTSITATSPLPHPLQALPPFNLTISTLVLEHIPLAPFFATLSATLAPGGVALVTNMHEDMGRSSQAGFLREDGVKVRGRSWVYGIEEVMECARGVGLEVKEVKERAVGKEDLGVNGSWGLGDRGRKWVGVRVWVGFVFVKRGV
ncbi:hypothetical protein PTNB73_02319 [Pyrenophora teres f. teres]|nr:hypothetical protein HRS9139_00904 [Pyrenophora teres f. teres]KAE8848477.1 hypothetical protein PTNB85_02320 [Pyrenophora teres f. teres]KAE8868402.1 hypothetical protein PTNB29_02313 [Pyrenophora teres f. teres]KAE8873168.1 hypothetical protein PTNB73_02319 [Pyrenophora teres f. teres]